MFFLGKNRDNVFSLTTQHLVCPVICFHHSSLGQYHAWQLQLKYLMILTFVNDKPILSAMCWNSLYLYRSWTVPEVREIFHGHSCAPVFHGRSSIPKKRHVKPVGKCARQHCKRLLVLHYPTLQLRLSSLLMVKPHMLRVQPRQAHINL